MKHKEGFKRLSLDDMKERRRAEEAKQVMDKHVDRMMKQVDEQIDKTLLEVLQELGFKQAVEGITVEEVEKIHAELLETGHFLNISKEVDLEGGLTVKFQLVKCMREINFNFSLDEEK